MKGQLLVAELTILFQHGTAQNLFGIETHPARVVALCADQVPVNQIEKPRGLVENPGDLFEFAGDGFVGGGGEEARLSVLFSVHGISWFLYLLNDISVLRTIHSGAQRKMKAPNS